MPDDWGFRLHLTGDAFIDRTSTIHFAYKPMILSTERTLFKRLTLADARALNETVGNPNVMRYWVGGADRSIEQTERRITGIEDHWQSHNFGDWGVMEKQSKELIGFCGLHYIKGMSEVNLGYALMESKWRQGYATEVCKAVLAYGFATLGLPLIVAVIWPENSASIGLARKLGMRFRQEITWGGGPRVVYSLSVDNWKISGV